MERKILPVSLPESVTNNAVTYGVFNGVEYLVSFSGLSVNKHVRDVHSKVWLFDFSEQAWTLRGEVPNGEGRLASIAVTVGNKMVVFGGYTVGEDGSEASLPYVHEFDPSTATFVEKTPMPVPVDDAIALVYQNRYVYLVSGWHDLGNVNLVQRYDTQLDRWDQATPYPGAPVFGHAGAIVDDQLLICGGSKIVIGEDGDRSFVLSDACYMGRIAPQNSRQIVWQSLEDPLGAARYRGIAVVHNRRIIFVGGTENPYNYDGIGYNRVASEPIAKMVSYDLENNTWEHAGILPTASMDHRGAIVRDGKLWLVGGMYGGQQVTKRISVVPLIERLTGPSMGVP